MGKNFNHGWKFDRNVRRQAVYVTENDKSSSAALLLKFKTAI